MCIDFGTSIDNILLSACKCIFFNALKIQLCRIFRPSTKLGPLAPFSLAVRSMTRCSSILLQSQAKKIRKIYVVILNFPFL